MNDIWYIAPDGANFEEAVVSIRDVISETVLPWLSRYTNRDYVLERFRSTEILLNSADEVRGLPYSPARASVVCGILLSRGDVDSARRYLVEALEWANRKELESSLLNEYWNSFTSVHGV